MTKYLCLISVVLWISCKQSAEKLNVTQHQNTAAKKQSSASVAAEVEYAKGFQMKVEGALTYIELKAPWPDADHSFTYVLINKDQKTQLKDSLDYLKNTFDALIFTPVQRVIATSTTHIPAFELLEVSESLIGFPGTDYISSPALRDRIKNGQIRELGKNESLNEEVIISAQPDLLIGFGVSGQNKTYNTLSKAGIPVVYNGDWVEETPLGKAEWIKFMGAFFEKQQEADRIFNSVVSEYQKATQLADNATHQPTVISGSMFKDIWYAPAGESWLAHFFKDANADYLWKDSRGSGSLSLNFETVLIKAKQADYWIGSGQFTSYDQLRGMNPHYTQFDFFEKKKIYTYGRTLGDKGGMLYYELAPTRPDVVLKDIIHILHPGLLPDHKPVFFKPLQP